jgi:AmmeMemoRadiSam system protein B
VTRPIREPVVAGQFYAGTRAGLLQQIEEAYLSPLGPGTLPVVNQAGPREILGLVCPHAGYPYSGHVAATSFAALAADGLPETVVVLGFSHRSRLSQGALQTSGAWRTPLGEAPIDESLAAAVAARLPEMADSVAALSGEHSLEVQVPFLQHLYGDALRFVPVMMDDQSLESARRVGAALAEAAAGRDVVIVASTDMTHYLPAATARRQDLYLAEFIRTLDAEGLIREARRQGITMCGTGPTGAMILAAQALGATRGEVLAYHHSGEVAPMAEVVGYLSAKVVR